MLEFITLVKLHIKTSCPDTGTLIADQKGNTADSMTKGVTGTPNMDADGTTREDANHMVTTGATQTTKTEGVQQAVQEDGNQGQPRHHRRQKVRAESRVRRKMIPKQGTLLPRKA